MLIWSSCKNYVRYESYGTLDISDMSPDQLIAEVHRLKDKYPSSAALFCTLDHRQEKYDDSYAIFIDEWRKPTLAEKEEKAREDENLMKIKHQAYERLKKELGYD